ncbi:MAG TPA: hypothetical protein PLQ52_08860 [Lacunisphaera sp.]|jgi:hypothetical protein|nr:hypothetical protein [Lacunisphaera sp.]HQY06160.1 hypothetical protein [Lacunisphaera sp.]
MARIWTEDYDPSRHRDKMAGVAGVPTDEYWKAPTLQKYPVYFVKVGRFTFEFHSIEQLRACLAYYEKKIRPSSRRHFTDEDRKIMWLHWIAQRWFEKLPMYLLEEKNRLLVVKALTEAVARFDKKPNKRPEPMAVLRTAMAHH